MTEEEVRQIVREELAKRGLENIGVADSGYPATPAQPFTFQVVPACYHNWEMVHSTTGSFSRCTKCGYCPIPGEPLSTVTVKIVGNP